MNLHTLLIFILILNGLFMGLAIWTYRIARKLRKGYSWQIAAAQTANQNYRKNRQILVECNKSLQDQLEAAEKKWGEADTQCKWHEREMELFLRNYKELELTNDKLERHVLHNKELADKLEMERLRLIDQLEEMSHNYLQLQNTYNNLSTQNDPHAFPM